MSNANGGNKMNNEINQNYLINWRNSLWLSIREKEGNCWKFLAFYMPAIAAIASFGFDKLSLNVVVLSILLLTAWGTIVAIDANHWFNRNLKIITNIEKFVAPYIYDNKLLPRPYAEPRFNYFLTYRTIIRILNIIFLVNILWFSQSAPGAKVLKTQRSWMLMLFWILGLTIWVFFEDRQRRFQYVKFAAEAIGPPADGQQIDLDNVKREIDKLSREHDINGPVALWLTSSLQLISISIIFEYVYPAHKAGSIYLVLLFFPFLTIFLNPLFIWLTKLRVSSFLITTFRVTQIIIQQVLAVSVLVWAFITLIKYKSVSP
jgi:hypothetical protein